MINKEEQILFQYSGKEANTSCSVEAKNMEEAKQLFSTARDRLLQVNEWHNYAGIDSPVFQLTDENGKPLAGTVKLNDFIRIDLSANEQTGNPSFLWLQVKELEEQLQHYFHAWIAIKVRSAIPPDQEHDRSDLYRTETTSSFVIERRGYVVTASVYGKNESPNNHVDGLLNTLRNTLYAVTAVMRIKNSHWQSFVKGLLKQG